MTAVIDNVWPLFLVPTKVVLSPVVVTMDGETNTMTPVEAEVLVWAVPWPQLMLLVGIGLLILALVWGLYWLTMRDEEPADEQADEQGGEDRSS